MINYIWGSFNDVKESIKKGVILNGCNENIMHSKVYNGRNPSISIFNNFGNLQAIMVHEFIPYDEIPLITRLFCGSTSLDIPKNKKQYSNNSIIHSFDILKVSLIKKFEKEKKKLLNKKLFSK